MAPVRAPETGRWLTTHLLNRKFVIWLNQGVIVDRTKEHLAESDRGLVMMRGKVFNQLDLVADGGEPKAVLRDPRANRGLRLPLTGQRLRADADAPPGEPEPRIEATAETDGFPYLAGQPPDAEAAYRRVREGWEQL
jgi:hypothetical protein